ncbi:hypothetical protein F7725_027008 [Dissostichus mawsoni]|uniref:Uncharacterized protein n=1 Tax=Dissostichus mawsoni TaxID=36200 RepID=A0A7J5X955_DISMA|nr:hypothetical protein F7725_027008 [Dissostichus mawsoni]
MEVNHTGVNIAEQLGEVADTFAIPNYKRVAVAHDNASHMKLCTETLKKEPEKWGNLRLNSSRVQEGRPLGPSDRLLILRSVYRGLPFTWALMEGVKGCGRRPVRSGYYSL